MKSPTSWVVKLYEERRGFFGLREKVAFVGSIVIGQKTGESLNPQISDSRLVFLDSVGGAEVWFNLAQAWILSNRGEIDVTYRHRQGRRRIEGNPRLVGSIVKLEIPGAFRVAGRVVSSCTAGDVVYFDLETPHLWIEVRLALGTCGKLELEVGDESVGVSGMEGFRVRGEPAAAHAAERAAERAEIFAKPAARCAS